MATGSKSKKKLKSKVKMKKNGKNAKEIAYLEKLIFYSLRSAESSSESLVSLFMGQVTRLKGKIKKLEENQ
jgi:hypothetical protein